MIIADHRIPDDWAVATVLGSVSTVMDYRGRTPKKLGMDWGDGTIPALSAKNVRMGGVDLAEECYLGSEALYRKWMTKGDVQAGDVLITTEAPLGNVAPIPDGRRYILSQRTVLLRPDPTRFDAAYYLRFLQSPGFQQALVENATGSTALGIQRRRLERLAVYQPPLHEQERIGVALSDADELITKLEALIAKKAAMKRGMMQQLLTGQIRLPGFHGEWRAATFASIATPTKQRTDPKSLPSSTPLVELEHIDQGSGRLLAQSTAVDAVSLKTVFQPGDVLFGKLRAYLRKYWLADGSGVCSTEIWALRASPATRSGYLRYLVETERFIEAASGGYGTHMPRSDWRVVRGLEFGLPPTDEQDAIAAVLHDADRQIELLSSRLQKAKSVKHGMMQQLLTGRTRLPVAVAPT